MKRTLAHRLAALGLVAMFQVGAMPSLEHVACIGMTMASHGGSMQGMHAGHQGAAAGHSTDDEAPKRKAPCCCDGACICPVVQPALVSSSLTSGPLGEMDAQRAWAFRNGPTLSRVPYLLPLANAPPAA